MRIALVHDWMTGMGEREKVLLPFLELFPDADLFTLGYDAEKMGAIFQKRRVTTSFLQRLPFGKTHPGWYLPLYWEAMRGFDLSSYDLVVSLNSVFAKWVRTSKEAKHVCYLPDSMGFLWEKEWKGTNSEFPGWEVGFFRSYLRKCDLKSNESVTRFLAGSDDMKTRIQWFYGREAEVIPPTMDARFLFKMQVYFRRLHGIKIIPDDAISASPNN